MPCCAQVTETKSAVKVLIAFQLKPSARHLQAEIMKVKQEISNDVSGHLAVAEKYHFSATWVRVSVKCVATVLLGTRLEQA